MQKKHGWKTIKDLIGKAKMNKPWLPQKIRVKKADIFDKEKIATEFNRFFAHVGQKAKIHLKVI